jgi:hypothetical protein
MDGRSTIKAGRAVNNNKDPTIEIPIMMTASVGTNSPIHSINRLDKKATGIVKPSSDEIGTMKNMMPMSDGIKNLKKSRLEKEGFFPSGVDEPFMMHSPFPRSVCTVYVSPLHIQLYLKRISLLV